MNRGEFSAVTGLPVELIADYERERQPLPGETLLAAIGSLRLTPVEQERLIHSIPHFDPPEWWSPGTNELPPPYETLLDEIDAEMIARLRQFGTWRTLKGGSPEEVKAEMAQESRRMWEYLRRVYCVKEMILQAKLRKVARTPLPVHRKHGAEQCSRLDLANLNVLRIIVKHPSDPWSWTLCEKMGLESLRLSRKSPEKARELAELTVQFARRIKGEAPWRRRLRGFAFACLGNAQLAQGDRAGAEEALAKAQRNWDAGKARGTDILDETPLQTLSASLRRSQRK